MANIKAVIRQQKLSVTVPRLVSDTVNYMGISLKTDNTWAGYTIVCFLTKINNIAENKQIGLWFVTQDENLATYQSPPFSLSAGLWEIWFMGTIYNAPYSVLRRITTEPQIIEVGDTGYMGSEMTEEQLNLATQAYQEAYEVWSAWKNGELIGPPGPQGEPGPDDYILVQESQPTSVSNAVWIKPSGDVIELATQEDIENITDGLVEKFSTSENYSSGKYVLYQNKIYQYITDHTAGAWDSSEVEEAVLCDKMTELEHVVDGYNNNVAPEFSENISYVSGEYVLHNGILYKFITNHAAGSWSNEDVNIDMIAPNISNIYDELSTTPIEDYISRYNITIGEGVSSSTGEIVYGDNYARSEYIDTRNSTAFALIGNNAINYCLYDENKSYISGYTSPGQTVKTLPNNAKYIIFTARPERIEDIKVHLYDANTLISTIEDDLTTIKSYNLEKLSFDERDYIDTDYISKFSVINNETVDSNTGEFNASTAGSRSDYIELLNANAIAFTGDTIINCVFFDINKNYVSGTTSTGNTINVPITSKYVIFSARTTKINNVAVHLYNAYGYMREALPWCRNMHINWIGDSIIAGSDFDEIVCDTLNIYKDSDYGIGGSTIALKEDGTDTRNAICVRYTEMSNDADIIGVSAGTNDFEYAWCPIGTIDDPDDGTSNNTFYGALKTLCKGLIDKYPTKVIFFTTPIKRAQPFESGNGGTYTPNGQMLTPFSKNKYGKTLMDYANIIKEVCGYYSIPVLDMYSESLLNPHIASQQSLFDSALTHPNSTGKKIMARRVSGWLSHLEGLINGI